MKKALTLSVLLLANIAVLAHSAIPHHYHEGVPVVVSGVCDVGGEEVHPHGYRHHHHAPDNATIEDCRLKQLYARVANDEQQPDAAVGNVFLLPCTPYLISAAADAQRDLSSISFAQKPYVQSYHTIFVARSLGLRAPPAC